MKILIADDKQENLYYLETLLKGGGYQTISARNGAEALELARKEKPDLIITDILMPVMDGYSLCRECKKDTELKKVPIIFYTATYTDPKDEEFAHNLGADRFILKPQEPDDFLEIIKLLFAETNQRGLPPTKSPELNETIVLKEYNETLIRKLEDKMRQTAENENKLKQYVKELEENIERRIKTEEALKQSESYIKNILDNLPVGIAVNSVEPSVNFRYMNDNFPKFYRTTRAKLSEPDSFWTSAYEDSLFREEMKKKVLEDCASGDPERMSWEDIPITRKGRETAFISAKNIPLSKDKLMISTVWDVTERKQMELARKESEENYRDLYSSIRDAIIVANTDREIIDCNPTFTSLFGYSLDEIRYKKTIVIYENEKQFIELGKALKENSNSESPFLYTVNYMKKDGKVFPGETNIFYLKKLNGDITGFIGLIRDVTERKLSEEALRQSEEKYRNLVDNMREGVFTSDEKGMITFANKELAKIHGFETSDQLLNRNFEEFIDPACKDEIVNEHKAFIQRGEVQPLSEFPIVKQDGSLAFVQVRSNLVFERERIIGLMGLVQDITKSKQAEEALRASQSFLDNIIEHSPHAMWISDASGTLIRLNEACRNLLHITNDEVVGKYNILKDTIVIEQGNLPLVKKVFEENKIAKFSLEYDTSQLKNLKLRNNTSLSLDVTISPVLNTEGKVINAIIQHIDITERVLAEKRQDLTAKILSILNRPNEWQQLVKDILEEMKKFTDFGAVGIRLKAGEDFPYFETNGFPAHFVEFGKSICARDLTGNIIRDSHNKPILECMCGNVISGRTDPSVSSFTHGGSFWSNNLTVVPIPTSAGDHQSHMRNHCITEGYESIALVPIHSGNEIIGLLQFSDKRPNRFTLDLIEFFEEIGSTIGIAFNRMQSENIVKESEEKYRALIENLQTGLIIHAPDTTVTFSNKMAPDILGLSYEQMMGKKAIDPAWCFIREDRSTMPFKEYPVNLVISTRASLTNYLVGVNRSELGDVAWVLCNGYPVLSDTNELLYVVIVVLDITERKNAIEKISASLKEKEVLLREIHHRVKNNMQVISSLLKLQANYVDNKEVAAAFEDSNLRIRSMSLVHEKLYQSHNLSRIDFKEYMRTLTNELARASNIDMSKIHIDITDFSAVSLDIDFAIPCGLLINELVSNAFKYAFPGYKDWEDSKKGFIKITLCTTGIDDIELEVSDNGVGLPADFNLIESKTLGLHLVSILVENQLNGSLKVSSEHGAKFKIKFKEKSNG
ncbi:MAG: PAS domain S-box protein [Bacteroidetes bacterium]|nr:PAS domain S-box protein [Bacteroidota bacterium]